MNEGKTMFPKWAIPVIVALVAAITVTVLFLTGVIGTKNVEVPDILNMNAKEAQEVLEKAGLEMCITQKEINDKVDENTVLEQSPISGEKIEKDSVINVTVSEKPIEVEIPDVVNFQKDLAVETLQNMGFKVEIVEKETDEFADGSVLSQNKTGKANTGSVIIITVAKNNEKESDKMVKVPSIVGKTLMQAKDLLKGNFYVMISGEEYSETVKKGAIISQLPTANSEVKINSVIKVVISKGKASDAKIVVPSVTLATRAQAITTLENLGLKVKVKEKFSDSIASGVVISQSIPKGKVVSANTEVTIVVSKGKQPEESKTTANISDLTTLTTSRQETTTRKNPSQNVTTQAATTARPSEVTTVPADNTDESKYIADFKVTTDKANASAGDVITVSVKLKTNYRIGAVSLPVIYDARVFEIVGTDANNVSSFLNFTGTLTENAYKTNGNWKSPESMYTRTSNPDKWLDKTTMANYKIILASWAAIPSEGTVMTALNSQETIVTFKLKVKSDVSDTSGRIFLSQDFIKTASAPQGLLSVGRATSDKITADSIVATGQTINLREATAMVTIK
ncbi:MAG: PASTA domain-containing protein [Clostridia bacterium]|nr:PASTA domain-containing protein [Clostridia bacterium]